MKLVQARLLKLLNLVQKEVQRELFHQHSKQKSPYSRSGIVNA